jgi:formylglycine-generating enzyme required for sulfatase activity
MKKTVLFGLLICLLGFQLSSFAKPLERIYVEGGKMEYKDRKIAIGSFEITKYEITNSEFAAFLNAKKTGSDGILNGRQIINITSEDLQLEYLNAGWVPKSGRENHPMVMVSYYGAVDYCQWVGGKLPTAEEWTYAAKGGLKSKHYIYAGGNDLDQVGWYRGNCGGHSHQVGTRKPNELGIYDMSGNAWEWCLNDSLKTDEDFVLHMGGSWYPEEEPGRISSHFGNTPTHFSNSVGFRVIFPIEKKID